MLWPHSLLAIAIVTDRTSNNEDKEQDLSRAKEALHKSDDFPQQ